MRMTLRARHWLDRRVSAMSIRSKVRLVVLVISAAALILASIVVVAMAWVSSREGLLRDLTAQAEMLSDNCAAAIAFEDAKDAKELLGAFKAMRNVRVASVYTADGALLAAFRQEESEEIPRQPPITEGARSVGGRLEIAKAVELHGEVIGSVFLRSDLTLVHSFIRVLLLTLAASLVLAFLVTLALTNWFQRVVSLPAIRLAAVAKRVSEERDFSIRAVHETSDEIGVLSDTFNQVLDAVAQGNRALANSERNYREIFEGVSDAILIQEAATGCIVDINSAMLAMFGYEKSEALGLSIGQLSSGEPPYTQKEVARLWSEVMRDGLATIEWHSKRKDGSLFWTDIALRRAEIGDEVRVVAVVRNIDERKRMEAQLRQAQKMEAIGTLAGGIAHDFNNILQAIIGNIELVKASLALDSELKEPVDSIDRASRRAADLVRRILTLSRQGDVVVQDVHVKSVVKEALALLRASIPATIAFQPSLVSERFVRTDPTRVHQIVMNLVTNAFHAMREKGGTVSVLLEDVDVGSPTTAGLGPGSYVRLTVADTGHGMPQDVVKRIFDPYFTTKERGEGTGLGLSVVGGIVKNMGGRVDVTSQVGVGTSFFVHLPAVADSSPRKVAVSQVAPTGKGHILVVDDEPSLAAMCQKTLRLLGYEVDVATSPDEGLAAFRSEPASFDLVITDMTMPRKTGLVLAGELRALRPDLPIVLTTGYSEQLSEDRLDEYPISVIVRKPYTRVELATTIRRLLDGSA